MLFDDEIPEKADLDNTEDDDPTAKDEDNVSEEGKADFDSIRALMEKAAKAQGATEDEGDEDEDEDEPLKTAPKAKAAAKTDVKEDAAKEEAKAEGEAAKETSEPAPEAEKPPETVRDERGRLVYSDEQQAHMTAVITDRVAQAERGFEKKLAEALAPLREIEEIAGRPITQLRNDLLAAQVESYAEQNNVTVEEARRDLARRQAEAKRDEELRALRQEQERMKGRDAYRDDKAKIAAHKRSAIAKKFEKEVDGFAEKAGYVLPYNSALYHEIGRQVFEGNLLDDLERSVEQRVLADVAKRGGAKPEGAAQSGSQADNASLSSAKREFAKFLGVPEKEYARQERIIQKRRGRA